MRRRGLGLEGGADGGALEDEDGEDAKDGAEGHEDAFDGGDDGTEVVRAAVAQSLGAEYHGDS